MKRPPEEIKKDISEHLLWDDRINAARIDVEVHEDGAVALNGEAPSHLIRRAAEQDVRVIPGVSRIANEIQIVHKPSGPARSGEQLATTIRDLFAIHPELADESISVDVQRQEVTLKGAVKSLWKRLRAEEIASGVEGADIVRNHLAVTRSELPVDQEVASRIQSAVKRSGVDPDRIAVDVSSGKVTLGGTVDTWEQYAAVHDAALYTRGVAELEDHVRISG